MPILRAGGKTYHWREWFKVKGFSWDNGSKEWVHKRLDIDTIGVFVDQMKGKGIDFHAYDSDGKKIYLGNKFSSRKHTQSNNKGRRKKKLTDDRQKRELEKIEEQAKARDARERASHINTDPPPRRVNEFGSREAYNRDRGSWRQR